MHNIKTVKLFTRVLADFVFFCIPFVFWQAAMDPFGPVQLMLARVFLPALILSYFTAGYLEGKVLLVKSPLLISLGLYLAVSFVSVFFSINKEISFKYFHELFLYILGAYVIASFEGKQGILRIVYIVLVSHALMAMYGIMQHFGLDFFAWNTNFAGRPLGTIGNPDFFAGQLLFAVFLSAAYFAFEKKRRVLTGFVLGVCLLCLYYTQVMGAYIGLAAGFAAFAVIVAATKKEALKAALLKYKKQILIVSLVVIVALAALSPVIIKKASALFEEKKRSLVHRLLMWEASLVMVKEAPVAGKGIGSYRLNYPYYQGQVLASAEHKHYSYVVTWMPHQNYLLIAAETGLLGLGFFLAALAVFFIFARRIFIVEKQVNAPAAGIACAIAALCGASFFNTFYNIAATAFYFFFFMFALFFFSGERRYAAAGKKFIAAMMALSLAALFYGIWTDGRTLLSNVYLKRANSKSDKGDFAAAFPLYNRIVELKPVELCPQTDVAQYYYLAETYRKAGDYQNAIINYKKDLKINPYCPEVNNMLGAMSGQFGNFEDAVKHLTTAVFTAPHYEAAYTNLGTAHIMKKDYASARKVFEDFISKNGPSENISKLIAALDALEKGRGNAK